MPNLSLTKNISKTLDPNARIKSFDEVSLGFTPLQAKDEANRCLNCKDPKCVKGCPVNIQIPRFIEAIRNENIDEAYRIITIDSFLPQICGRVCPQESQCEKECVRSLKGDAVAIGKLERYVADNHTKTKQDTSMIKPNGKKVAVIGSGPSGLTCAYDLARKGYSVKVFEALHTLGGVLTYGIPEFRLPKKIVNEQIETLKELNIEFETNVVIGRTITIDELLTEFNFAAVYLSTGAGLPRFMNIKGENLKGVYSANEFLTRINLMKAYKNDSSTPILKLKNVAVVGGGNVAMDAARCALRLGAEKVFIVYRRSLEELPARKEEVEHAKEEGIIFNLLNNPVEIMGDENGFVNKIKVIKMELGEADSSGRRRPIEIEGSEYEMDVDSVIMALGTSPNPLIKNSTQDLEFDNRGCIIVDKNTLKTSKEKVYAGGDAVSGAATVILAMGAGKKAAKSIDEYLSKQ